jgi:hypothetical protein
VLLCFLVFRSRSFRSVKDQGDSTSKLDTEPAQFRGQFRVSFALVSCTLTSPIYKVPSNVSVEQYPQKYLALVENWIARPAVRKNLIEFEQVRRRTIVSKFQQTISLTVVFKVAAQQYACQPPPHARLPPTSAHLRPTC